MSRPTINLLNSLPIDASCSKRCNSINPGWSIQPSTVNSDKFSLMSKRAIAAVSAKSKPEHCLFCKKDEHKIHYCPAFLNLSLQVRCKEVKGLKICLNYLREGHVLEACGFSTCRLCQKRHNTLLHYNKGDNINLDSTNRLQDSSESLPSSSETPPIILAHCTVCTNERGLLTTAIIKIQDNSGEYHECRAFVDLDPQINFMTQNLCDKLQLPRQNQQLAIRGINNVQMSLHFQTHATIQSKFNAFKIKLNFSVVPKIITSLPLSEINII